MKTNEFFDAMGKIDPALIERAERKVVKRSPFVRVMAIMAACFALLAVAIPAVATLIGQSEPPTVVIEHDEHIPPTDVRADDTNVEVKTPPEHDGSKGLIYEIREDGNTARFVSFGTCTEETVVIANTYDGLPVVEMTLKDYWEVVKKEDGIHIDLKEDYFVYGNEYVKNLIISDTVEKFDTEILTKCKNIESIYIGANIRHKLAWPLSTGEGENINKIEVSPDNEVYMSRGNCIINKATKTLVRGCKTSIIPDDGSVETIGNHAFQGVVGLKNIVIPDCIKVIDAGAFASCRDLESIVLPAGLEKMEFFAFDGCQKLISVDLNGLEVVPMLAFYSNDKLVEVKGIENVTEIGDYAFAHCHSLENFTLGKGLKKIGKSAFSHSVVSINYEGTIEEWNAIEKGEAWQGFSTPYYLDKIVCSDGIVMVPSMNR